jgi:transcriptional regulator with XRE-family HTH domain
MPVNFAEIKRRREQLSLTMEEAARRAGHAGDRARIWWNDVESGRASPDLRISTLEAVARVLGCRVDDLLTGEPPGPVGRPTPAPQKRRRPSGSAGSKG